MRSKGRELTLGGRGSEGTSRRCQARRLRVPVYEVSYIPGIPGGGWQAYIRMLPDDEEYSASIAIKSQLMNGR